MSPRGSIESEQCKPGPEPEYNYVLVPSCLGYLVPIIVPCIFCMAPFLTFRLAPEIFYRILKFFDFSSGIIATTLRLSYSEWWNFLLFGGISLCMLNIGIQEIRRRSTKLKLADTFLVYKKGLFFLSVDKVYFGDIRVIKVEKSLIGKLLNVGHVGIATAGTGGFEVYVHGYKNPEGIMEYITRERTRIYEGFHSQTPGSGSWQQTSKQYDERRQGNDRRQSDRPQGNGPFDAKTFDYEKFMEAFFAYLVSKVGKK